MLPDIRPPVNILAAIRDIEVCSLIEAVGEGVVRDGGRLYCQACDAGQLGTPSLAISLAYILNFISMGKWSEGCQKFEMFCGLRTGVV